MSVATFADFFGHETQIDAGRGQTLGERVDFRFSVVADVANTCAMSNAPRGVASVSSICARPTSFA